MATTTEVWINSTNSTGNCTGNCCQSAESNDTPMYVGFICAAVSVVLFGSNFIPVKKFKTGDGMFFQWILCAGIWFVGLIVNIIQGFHFYYLSLLGGALWATGNICVVPVIQTIGLALGLLVWGTTNLLTGWASGSFGWFGTCKETPNNPAMNYIGVSIAVLSALSSMNIKSNVKSTHEENVPETESLLKNNYGVNNSDDEEDNERSYCERLSPRRKRILGFTLSLISGVFYGINFTPNIYVQDRKDQYPNASENGLDYVFGHFTGIFLTSTVYFMIYCIFKKNKPKVYPKVILPAFASGVMWAGATASWFVANKTLGEPVAFPIITTGPGLVASLWGLLVFGEIRGKRNYLFLVLSATMIITGGILCGVSKS